MSIHELDIVKRIGLFINTLQFILGASPGGALPEGRTYCWGDRGDNQRQEPKHRRHH